MTSGPSTETVAVVATALLGKLRPLLAHLPISLTTSCLRTPTTLASDLVLSSLELPISLLTSTARDLSPHGLIPSPLTMDGSQAWLTSILSQTTSKRESLLISLISSPLDSAASESTLLSTSNPNHLLPSLPSLRRILEVVIFLKTSLPGLKLSLEVKKIS